MGNREFTLGVLFLLCATAVTIAGFYFVSWRQMEVAKVTTQAKTEQVKDRTMHFPWVKK